ncbi:MULTISPECIES: hypothetical protein [unclassified Crossiella]|uniref:hypothetical protein n=1 Tax=unclassified Crossiella TaxID=2620835 RepID=UPI001FFE9100|nr:MULTISPECIES: hypothetical protein [unclassified Crossiella]MCK2244951.1 hypothetical protein [Crossiella sp. S99.2]MCK2258496.1 hypothetical protein [Crossiella sp. S99.1]
MADRVMIKPDQVPGLIAKLEAELLEAKDLKEYTSAIGTQEAPAKDPASVELAKRLDVPATGPAGLVAAADKLIASLEAMITNLKNGLADYERQEQANRSTMKRA